MERFVNAPLYPSRNFQTDALSCTSRAIFHHIRAWLGEGSGRVQVLGCFRHRAGPRFIIKRFISKLVAWTGEKTCRIHDVKASTCYKATPDRISGGSRSKYLTSKAAISSTSCRPGTCSSRAS